MLPLLFVRQSSQNLNLGTWDHTWLSLLWSLLLYQSRCITTTKQAGQCDTSDSEFWIFSQSASSCWLHGLQQLHADWEALKPCWFVLRLCAVVVHELISSKLVQSCKLACLMRWGTWSGAPAAVSHSFRKLPVNWVACNNSWATWIVQNVSWLLPCCHSYMHFEIRVQINAVCYNDKALP